MILVILFCLIGPAACLALGAGPGWLGLGALSWVVGVLVKVIAAALTGILTAKRSPGVQSVAQGMVSAAAELGTAWGLLELAARSITTPDILAFAMGAGSFEGLLIVGAGLLSHPSPEAQAEWELRAQKSWLVRYQFALERAAAWGGHLGSRSLVAFGWSTGVWQPSVVVFLTFALTDGLAYYGHLRNWDWTDPAVLRRYLTIAGLLVGIELALLVVVLATHPD